jgi:hypothetical protein
MKTHLPAQGPLARTLDYWAIGHRIRKWHPQLKNIGTLTH